MKKKILALVLLTNMAFSSIVNAQEVTESGFNQVPVEYSAASTFTVVLPDSVELKSTKTQEFEIYLDEYELSSNEAVKVKPVNNKFIMESPQSKIEYYVGDNANSCTGMPEFPTYYFENTNQGGRYWVFEEYILTKESDIYYLYCAPKGENSQSRFHVYYGVDSKDNAYFEIRRGGTYSEYKDRDGTTVGKTYDDPYPDALYSTMFYRYKFNTETYTWDKIGGSSMPTTKDGNSITVIQSTLNIEDGDGYWIQYYKESKDPVEVYIEMSSEYLKDSNPITCTIDGTALTSGDWTGNILFEISLEKTQ